jgi:hypothetical protein
MSYSTFIASIASQYHAAVEMLAQSLAKCPEPMWHSDHPQGRFWHVAYHALFFTQLYLQESVENFVAWEKHREDYESLRELYDKSSLLDYLAICKQQVDERLSNIDLDAPSGFDWLPFSKFELQIYSIRHIQQHAGELMERLGQQNIALNWVSERPRPPSTLPKPTRSINLLAKKRRGVLSQNPRPLKGSR